MTESRTSEDSARLDPFDFWRQVYESNEQAWTKTMKDVITSEGYAEAQGKMLESFLMVQKMMREGMSAQLNNLNIPTRDDVARLGELLLSVEEKVDLLDDRFAGMDVHLARQARIEERLAGLDERLARLGSIEEKLAGLEERLARQMQVVEQAATAKGGAEAGPAKAAGAPAGRARPASETRGSKPPAAKTEK